MARQGDVFPRRDLPGTSENWGRHVEDRIVLGERSEIQLSQKVDNGLLANEGQLATISNQLNDIYDQQLVLQQQQIDLSAAQQDLAAAQQDLAQQQIDLSAAQQDLLGRESYATFWSNSSFSVSTNVSDVALPQLSRSFTIAESRTIKAQTFIAIASSRGSGAVSATFTANHKISPGPALNVSETEMGISRQVMVNEAIQSQVIVTSLFDRPAGSYTITPHYYTIVTPNGFITLISGVTTIDILQQA